MMREGCDRTVVLAMSLPEIGRFLRDPEEKILWWLKLRVNPSLIVKGGEKPTWSAH